MSRSLVRLLRRRRPPAWLACDACSAACVCPMDWAPADDEHWSISVRCGECGARADVRLTNAQAAAWDVELDRQMQPIADAVRRLDRERMAGEADAFIAALRHGLIDAADFA